MCDADVSGGASRGNRIASLPAQTLEVSASPAVAYVQLRIRHCGPHFVTFQLFFTAFSLLTAAAVHIVSKVRFAALAENNATYSAPSIKSVICIQLLAVAVPI